MSGFVSGNRKIGNNSLMRSNSESNSKRSNSKQGNLKRSNSRRSSASVRSFTQKQARKTIGRFMKKTEQKRKSNFVRLQAKKHTQKRARKTIARFMKKTENKRRLMFLKSICSDSGVCIAFGTESKKIFEFFNGFTNFEYVTKVKTIGKPSSNGFVKEFEYNHDGYLAHTVLKSSSTEKSDNLMYEHDIGLEINKHFLKKFPCFVETYGWYKYKQSYDRVILRGKTGKVDLNSLLTKQSGDFDIAGSCSDPLATCILIQHIKDAETISDKIQDQEFLTNDLLYSLYQIYLPLSALKDQFTHYDLHDKNVMMYKPVDGKYLEYHYHLANGTVVSFKSQYISKIIDYGRSYINIGPSGKGLSKIYREELCKNPACNSGNDVCGDYEGYGWLEPPADKVNHYMCSSERNMSHDLRLLKIMRDYIDWDEPTFRASPARRELWYNIVEGVIYEETHGTPQADSEFGYISNVTDAEAKIRESIMKPELKDANDAYYSGMAKLGDLHVYTDKPMEYIPS